MSGPARAERRREALSAGLAAAVAALPFLPLLAGRALFFRDLARYFFPLRRFAAEGLRAGQLRWWNPYAHEGEPMALLPIGYPPDLLQVLWPDERWLSLLLAAHIPLAALACFALARALGAGRTAAAGAAIAYAAGGFALSSVNLYVYVQALAWAPLVVLGMMRAADGPRPLALGALAAALCLTSGGVEVAAQAVILGAVLALEQRPRARTAARLALLVLLAAALAAVPLALMAGQVAGSARGAGFPTAVVLGHSVHPMTLLQVVSAGLYGDPANLVERWWGQNFFPRGFPYLLSLYLGATLLALALVGAAGGGRRGRVLAAVAAVACVVCLGRWAGLTPVVDHVPALHRVRFPVKAFFTVHAAAALLAALGLQRLAGGARGAWRLLAAAAGAAGVLLALIPLAPRVLPAAARWFAGGFFPPDMPWAARAERLGLVAADAATGGTFALCAAALAVAVMRGRLRADRATALLAGLVAGDLLRAGAGLNPVIDAAALRPSPEVEALAGAWRRDGGRVFTCDPDASAAYYAARGGRERHLAWSTWTLVDTLSPNFNVGLAVRSAFGPDLTMLVPVEHVLSEGEGCDQFDALADRLREAAVTSVISLDPLATPALAPSAGPRVERLWPLRIHVYALAGARPRFEVPGGRVLSVDERPGHVVVTLEADAPTQLIVRDSYARGWRAGVNGRPAAVAAHEGRHIAVPVPPGPGRVELSYRPPALGVAVPVAALALIATAWLLPWPRRAA